MNAETLIRELTEEVGLEQVDAHRSAFTALACASGWTKARVARYLGITRARVGQKFDKLLHYATTLDSTPTLTGVMLRASRTQAEAGPNDAMVEYTVADWEDEEFARMMIGHAGKAIPWTRL